MGKNTTPQRSKANPIAKDLRTPKYRQRVEKDRTKYDRGDKNKDITSSLDEHNDPDHNGNPSQLDL